MSIRKWKSKNVNTHTNKNKILSNSKKRLSLYWAALESCVCGCLKCRFCGNLAWTRVVDVKKRKVTMHCYRVSDLATVWTTVQFFSILLSTSQLKLRFTMTVECFKIRYVSFVQLPIQPSKMNLSILASFTSSQHNPEIFQDVTIML